MASNVHNVKITDLFEVEKLNPNHLFLVATPIGTVIDETTPYTSNSIRGDKLSASIKEALEGDSLTIVNDWHFHGGPENIPTQDTKLEIDDFIEALEDESKLSSVINDGEDGWYKNLSSSVMQDPNYISGDEQSINVINSGIPNIDFVQRIVAGAYQSLLNQLTTIISPSGDSHFIPSHLGEFIHSTRLAPTTSTTGWDGTVIHESAEGRGDALVRKIYGYGQKINGVQYPNTQWILHSGYFLRGASNNVSRNDNSDNGNVHFGGTNALKLTVNNLPNHTHTATFQGSSSTFSGSNKIEVSGSIPKVTGTSADSHSGAGSTSCKPDGTQSVSFSGSNSISVSGTPNGKVTVNSSGGKADPDILPLPRYKNVYIWERIDDKL